jgi:CubicO group peptidase (beta-lactamase class C family)
MTAWTYLDNSGDRRLASIVNTPGREFDYTTNAAGLIAGIAEQPSGQSWSFATPRRAG